MRNTADLGSTILRQADLDLLSETTELTWKPGITKLTKKKKKGKGKKEAKEPEKEDVAAEADALP